MPSNEPLRESKERPGEIDHREPSFNRSPWTNVTQGERENPRVTLWIGVKAIVISVSFPEGDPEDIRISIAGNRLQIRDAARSRFASRDIDLPCPVEARLIRSEDGKGTHYILLQKK